MPWRRWTCIVCDVEHHGKVTGNKPALYCPSVDGKRSKCSSKAASDRKRSREDYLAKERARDKAAKRRPESRARQRVAERRRRTLRRLWAAAVPGCLPCKVCQKPIEQLSELHPRLVCRGVGRQPNGRVRNSSCERSLGRELHRKAVQRHYEKNREQIGDRKRSYQDDPEIRLRRSEQDRQRHAADPEKRRSRDRARYARAVREAARTVHADTARDLGADLLVQVRAALRPLLLEAWRREEAECEAVVLALDGMPIAEAVKKAVAVQHREMGAAKYGERQIEDCHWL